MVLGLFFCSDEGAFGGVRQNYDTKLKTSVVYDTDTTEGWQEDFLPAFLFRDSAFA